MTSRLAICSRARAPRAFALLLSLCALPVLSFGVTGRVELTDSKDSAVKKRNFSGVVVWLEPSGATPVALQRGHAVMQQKNKKFIPHVLAISTGTTVDFPNLDPFFHNAFSTFEGQIFDVALYPPGSSKSVRFSRPGIVRVFCNIHPTMSAMIVVLNTPYFATTGPDGRFVIPNVAHGTYHLQVFHERATSETLEALARPVSIDTDDTQLGLIKISEIGYLPIAHKNKYGRQYSTPPDEQHAYSK